MKKKYDLFDRFWDLLSYPNSLEVIIIILSVLILIILALGKFLIIFTNYELIIPIILIIFLIYFKTQKGKQ